MAAHSAREPLLAKEAAPKPQAASSVVRPANLECEYWNDEQWQRLRRKDGVPETFANSGWTLADLQSSGAKGGSMMAYIADKYVVKELSAGDHEALLQATSSLCNHFASGPSILTPIYLHFRIQAVNRTFMVMRNMVGKGPSEALYDLKGCADDKSLELQEKKIAVVHKRFHKPHMWCGQCFWSKERVRYFEGKQHARKVTIQLPERDRNEIVSTIRRDVDFLIEQGVMDYSLLVAVKRKISSFPLNVKLFRVLRSDGTVMYLAVAIIDFLQKWTTGKRVAQAIKFLECDKATIPPQPYGERFAKEFEERFVSVSEAAAEKQQTNGNGKSDNTCVLA
mmetsp:Transcript_11575/g.26935  ORF Transcript_11575/g.26935 Transcript_11575/m.26935 type:complete len:337 (+) Transcript_11575:118-1128(+)|eukprot:CAMPEP_0178391750 /NCGR_PEP_ID=MMETSP0689_2-20121128/11325_1 /TAXON_ID=160604 /ORGANISM="Amphidinium massartii, Strain CS-259" /LENGTH=336 /DNA_ID=CAMNT_0020012305 /DNA_START=42 /DNA_END=1052 /DNA_ORIENTATION=+